MENRTKKQIERDEKIYEISTLVSGGFSLQETLDRLAENASRISRARSCSIRLLDDDSGELKMRSTYNLSEVYRNKGPVSKDDPVIKEAFEGKAVVIDNMLDDDRVKYREACAKEGLKSQLTVVMSFKNKPIGVLRLYSGRVRGFRQDDVAMARLVASQCAIAITNARLYKQAVEGARVTEQMRLAAVIQRRMIPKMAPEIQGLDMSAIYEPCFQVGGDLYDFIKVNDHTVVVAISDVIGKGIPAAIMMSMFRGTLRAYADGGYERHSFNEIISELNNVACRECRNGEFITLFIATIDVNSMQMTYCNCGHEPAMIRRGDDIIDLEKGGLVLGVMDDPEYDVETLDIKRSDAIVMYTDGLIDAVNFEGEFWSRERLVEVVKECCNCSAETLVHQILAYRRRFVGLARQIDDTSIVGIKVDPQADRDCGRCGKELSGSSVDVG